MASTVKDNVLRWRKKLERNADEYAILSVIHKLSKVSVTVDLLQDTGIGKVIRSLAKRPGKVGEKASALLHNWRKVVAVAQKPSDHSPKTQHVKHNSLKHENASKDNTVAMDHHVSFEKKSNKEKRSSELKYEQESENISFKPKDLLKSSKKLDVQNSNFQKNDYEKHKLSHAVPTDMIVSDDELLDAKDYYKEEMYKNNLKRKDGDLHTFEDMQPKSKKLKTSADLSSHDSSEEKDKKSHISSKQSNKISSDSQSHDLVNKGLNTKNLKESKTKKVKEEKKSNSDLKKTLKMQSTDAFTSSEVTFEDCLSFNDIVTVKRKKSSKTVSSPAKSRDKFTSEKKRHEKDQSRSKHSKSKHSDRARSNYSDQSGSKHSDESASKHSDQSGSKQSDQSSSKHTDQSRSKHTDQSRSKHSDQSRSKHSVTSSSKEYKPEEDKEKGKMLLVPLPKLSEIDIASTLPQPQLNYKPLPQRSFSCSPVKRKALTNEDAIMFTSSKKEKTCVYSGKKQKHVPGTKIEFPSLQEFCTRVLIENIDAIEYLGGLPYYLMKPVLERCTPHQLETIEDYNPTLLEDTHELWKVHCEKDFRKQSPQENETWRDLYLRAFDERERKLKMLTKNISDSMSKSNTGRLVKLTYVNSYVKPPRDVARKQERNGTGLPVNHSMKIGPPSKASPRPTAPAINSAATSNAKSDHVPKNMKPKVAPLMAKAMKSMKQCFRR